MNVSQLNQQQHVFQPAGGLGNPHLQTLLPRYIRKIPSFLPIWQDLELPDGDFVELAWTDAPQKHQAKNTPVFILFHGLEGNFWSPYAHGILEAFSKAGWLGVIMHFRGCGRKANLTARAYHSGETGDPRTFLSTIRELFPQNIKVATGISLGGNMLVRYLAQYRDDPIIDAATVVSAPLNLAASAARIEQGLSRFYQAYLLHSLKQKMVAKSTLLYDKLGITVERIRSIRGLREFDDLLTAPLHGYADSMDYYTQCAGITVLNEVSVPLQIIQAADDPLMTDAVIPSFTLQDSIDYKLFPKGGHVGFVSGKFLKPECWLESHLVQYYLEKFDSGVSTIIQK